LTTFVAWLWSAYGLSYRAQLAVFSSVVAFVFMFVLFPRAAAQSGSTANQTVDLQRAYTPEMFAAVLRRWSATNADAVGIVKRSNIIQLDLVFPLVYGIALAFAYASVRARAQPTPLDAVWFLCPLVASVFDYLENSVHLLLLHGVNSAADVEHATRSGAFAPHLVFAASMFAHMKFLLLAASCLAVIAAAVMRIIGKP
jgi:hypothetical protein